MAEGAQESVGTTALIAELLVIGGGGVLAALVLFDAAAGSDMLGRARSAGSLATAALVGVAYVAGTVLDRVADALGEPLGRRWRREFYPAPGGEATYHDALLRVLARPELERRLAYGRSRLRVCRGAALDGLLLIAALSIRAVLHTGPVDGRLLTAELSGAAVGVAGCVFAWMRLAKAQYREVLRQGS